MNLRQLECFFAVAETLHFGHAASRLFVAQSSVSEAVNSLESELGQRLLLRSTRRVTLTAYGAAFVRDVKPRYDELLFAYSIFRKDAEELPATRLAHTPELGQWLFPDLLTRIEALPPEAGPTWTPRLMHTPAQISAVLDGHVDLGLCWDPVVPDSIVRQVLVRTPFVAVLREDDPLRHVDVLRMQDLRGRHFLVSPRPDNGVLDARLRAVMFRAGLERSALEEVDRYDEIAVHVSTSRAIGVHPASVVGLTKISGIHFRQIDEAELWAEVCLISNRASAIASGNLLAELLRETAVAAASRTGSMLEGPATGLLPPSTSN